MNTTEQSKFERGAPIDTPETPQVDATPEKPIEARTSPENTLQENRKSVIPQQEMPPPPLYNIAVIRQLLKDAFRADDLQRFCHDQDDFKPILALTGTGAALETMIEEVIKYCERFLLFEELLQEIKKVNPRQYNRYRRQLGLEELSRDDDTLDIIPPPPPEQQHEMRQRYLPCWTEPIDSPATHVAFLDLSSTNQDTEWAESDPVAFTADEAGSLYFYRVTTFPRLIYKNDNFESRLFRVAVRKDRVFVGTWNGYLYCVGHRGKELWIRDLASPISALSTSQGNIEVAAGTWDGRIIALQSDKQNLWEAKLDDGISILSISQAGETIVIGSYAGHLAVLDSEGNEIWQQQMPTGIVQAVFDSHGRDLFVATRAGELWQIDAETGKSIPLGSLRGRPLDLALSGDDRQLVLATKEGSISLYSVDSRMGARERLMIEYLAQVLVSPLSPAGDYILALSHRKGVTFLDNRQKEKTLETAEPGNCIALCPRGQYMFVGGADKVSLYRLSRPKLKVKLEPMGNFLKGQSTQVLLTLENIGDRLARRIEMEVLSESIEYSELDLPAYLKAKGIHHSDQQTVTRMEDGDLLVHIRLKYVDDLGVSYDEPGRIMLDRTVSR